MGPCSTDRDELDARKALLTLHIALSVGWLGAVLAYLPLDVTTAASEDPTRVRAAYVAMDLMAGYVLVPLAITALASGVALSLVTSWGLFRHYWVVVSLVLTALATLVLLVETRTIEALAASAATASDAAVLALPSTLPHSIGGALVLVLVLALNVYKPRGLTRYGWRRRSMEQGARTAVPSDRD